METSGVESSTSLTDTTTAIAPTHGSHLLAVTRSGFASLDADSGRLTGFRAAGLGEGVRMNDACVDALGRCWAGSISEDGTARATLYTFDGARIEPHLGGLVMSNGIDWSPHNDQMYHVDSVRGAVTAWAFSLDEGAIARPRRVTRLAAAEGMPDGLTVDVEGGIWIAVWGAGEVRCIDPESGATRAVVHVPTQHVTSCTFGGDDYSTLFITTADEGDPGGGFLYGAQVGVAGRPANRFRPGQGT
jgi:sugar lactone lactonase YvrE